ncbi:hypothetical protein FF1_035172 [Malus domestica]
MNLPDCKLPGWERLLLHQSSDDRSRSSDDSDEEERKLLLECCADVPNKLWEREHHFAKLPYKQGWKMPHQTASHPEMPNDEELCKEEINSLLQLGLIRPSKSPWAS